MQILSQAVYQAAASLLSSILRFRGTSFLLIEGALFTSRGVKEGFHRVPVTRKSFAIILLNFKSQISNVDSKYQQPQLGD